MEKDISPLGLVSRLEAALGRFEVELAEERRTLAEVSSWLPGFKARLGDGQTLTAAITREAVESLDLVPGDAVLLVVKSTEVMVAKTS